MSADNGIYILKTKDQYRVIHVQAIDNLFYSHISNNRDVLVPTRLVEYFGSCRYTRNFDTAMKVAKAIEFNLPILEYGIKTFYIDKTWRQVVREAKVLAKLEIEHIKNMLKDKHDGHYDYSLKRLEGVLEYQ